MTLKADASTQISTAELTRQRHSSNSIARCSRKRDGGGGVSVPRLMLIGSLFLCTLTVSRYLNVPVPSGLENPWKYRVFCSGKYLVSDLAYVQELLLQRPYPIALRNLIESALFLSPSLPTEIDGSNIRAITTAIEGVKVRLYEPIARDAAHTPGPALIYLHGGGYFLGNIDTWDVLIRRIAEELDILVISVDYRLAPEHVYPAAFNDSFTVTKWLLENARSFGVDATRVGISGDSAGGALAASVAQCIHDDETLPELKYQALVYPLSQFLDINTPSQQKYRQDFGENGGLITWWEAGGIVSWYLTGQSDNEIILSMMKNNHTTSKFWRESSHAKFVSHSLLPERFIVNRNYTPLPVSRMGDAKVWSRLEQVLLDPILCPLMRENMTGLPPAFVATCGFDAIRDNGLYYARRLENDGVEVDWQHYEGGFHGVFGPTWPFTFKVGEEIFRDYIQFIKSHW